MDALAVVRRLVLASLLRPEAIGVQIFPNESSSPYRSGKRHHPSDVARGTAQQGWAQARKAIQNPPENLKQLSLEQLGNVEVTTASKEPEQVWRTPAAIYVITQEDIRRSGATSIAEVLRLAPGLEVARTDSDHWAVGIRGFGGQFSKSLLVLIDGRSVYSPLFSGVYCRSRTPCLKTSSESK